MDVLLPVGFAIGLWWLTTILLLWRMRLAERTFAATMWVAGALAALGMVGYLWSLGSTTVGGAYAAFASALLIWCGLETSYFLGYVTGPRPAACPPGVGAWRRFVYGVEASLYHELSVIAAVGVMAWLASRGDNLVGVQTFVVLWLMRWSTKLNIFFGVSNLHEHFWPDRLRYLSSYVRVRSGNAFFPLSIVLAVALGYWAGAALGIAAPASHAGTGAILVLTLLGLACLEHLFLMLPIPDEVLWRWGLGAPAHAASASAHETSERA